MNIDGYAIMDRIKIADEHVRASNLLAALFL